MAGAQQACGKENKCFLYGPCTGNRCWGSPVNNGTKWILLNMQGTLGLHPHSKVGHRGSYSGRSQTLNSDRKTYKDSLLFVSLVSWSMLTEGKELWSMLANGSCLTYCPERNLNRETGDGLEDAEKQTFGRRCGEAARVEMCTRHTTSRQSNGRAWPNRRRYMWTLNGQKAASLTDICWLDPPEQDGGCSTTMLSFYLHLSCFKKQTLRSLSVKSGIRRQIRFNWKCLFWWHEGFASHFSIQVNIVVTSASCCPTESRLKSNLNLICSVCLRRFHIEIDDVFLCVCAREFILFMNADCMFFCLIHSAGIRMENDRACWT